MNRKSRKQGLSIILTLVMVLSLMPTLTLPVKAQGIQYNFGGLVDTWDYEGTGFKYLGDKLLVSQCFAQEGTAIYPNSHNAYSNTTQEVIIKAQAGKSFTFLDLTVSGGYSGNELETFVLTLKQANGETIDTFTMYGSQPLPGYGVSTRNVSTFSFDKLFSTMGYENVSEIHINFSMGGGLPAADLMFESITLSNISASHAPILSNFNGENVVFTEGDSPVLLNSAGNATVTDSDNDHFNLGNLRVSITGNRVASEDVLSIQNNGGQISVSGNDIRHNGVLIGIASGGTGASDLVIHLNANATPAATTALVRALTYSNTNTTNPSPSTRTVRLTISDGSGGTSTAAHVTVNVMAVNDDPTLTGLPSYITVMENTASHVDLSAATFSDVDSGANSITLNLAVNSGRLIASDSGGVSVTGSYTSSLTLTGTVLDIDAFLKLPSNIRYMGATDVYGNNADTLTLTANDGGHTGAGGGADVSLGTVSIDITTTIPTVLNVTATKNDGIYGVGELIVITVEFSHAVIVTGTPQLDLYTGQTDRLIDYMSGSESTTLTFSYTTQMGDETTKLDYITSSALSLNGGSITRGDTEAILTLPVPGTSGSLGANKAIAVHTILPGAPMDVQASVISGEAMVEFTPPGDNGGSKITGYTVTSSPGGITRTGISSPIMVSGLSNGTSYTFIVTAENAAGIGPASLASNGVVPKASQTITFSNPGVQYFGTNPTLVATSSAGGGYPVSFSTSTPEVCTVTSDGVLTFLRSGEAIIIASQVGDFSYLPAEDVSQTFWVGSVEPSAPTGIIATAGDAKATVNFTPPTCSGGGTITGYTVKSYPDGITASGSTNAITVTGLTNGQAYTFTVTAQNEAGIGVPSSASNSVTPRAITNNNPNQTPSIVIPQVPSNSTDTQTYQVDIRDQSNQISEGESVVITIPTRPNTNSYLVGIPFKDLSTEEQPGNLIIDTDKGRITIPTNMLSGVAGITGNQVQLNIGTGNKENLSDAVKASIGDRPLIQLTLTVDGKPFEWHNPFAPVTVSIPYTPTKAELENPESIVIWYIDGNSNVVAIPNGRYNVATGSVTFSTTHFSHYAVVFNKVDFKDVADHAWYFDAVNFIASRGIATGIGDGKYSPEGILTRGAFIVLLMNAYEIAQDPNPTDNFSDAGSTYYTGYLAAAKRLGITSGIGNNEYAPDNPITRQEMFTLLYNALNSMQRLPKEKTVKRLADFNDAASIDPWAVEAMTRLVETGIVTGSNEKLTPTGTTTRGEMAQVLYNLMIN